jgi:hypothetical protein
LNLQNLGTPQCGVRSRRNLMCGNPGKTLRPFCLLEMRVSPGDGNWLVPVSDSQSLDPILPPITHPTRRCDSNTMFRPLPPGVFPRPPHTAQEVYGAGRAGLVPAPYPGDGPRRWCAVFLLENSNSWYCFSACGDFAVWQRMKRDVGLCGSPSGDRG